MRGSGYKISVKSAAFQFLFYPMVEIDASCIVNDAGRSKENHRETTGKKSKKVMKKKKKIQRIGKRRKNHPLGNIESRNATYPIYSLN